MTSPNENYTGISSGEHTITAEESVRHELSRVAHVAEIMDTDPDFESNVPGYQQEARK